jgi:hypothetical protein
MRTSATYMFDGQKDVSEVSLAGSFACIEFRGNDSSKIRRHYVRIDGLSAKECEFLAARLKKASKALRKSGQHLSV